MVKHNILAPVHVIGHGRSGTSILIGLIRKYLQISFGTESQFIIRYYKQLNKYGDLGEDENLLRLVQDISKERCFKRWNKFNGFTLDPNQFLKDVRVRTYRGVLDAAFQQLARHNRMERWGDKTPEYVFNLPVIEELFPDGQFIHIVRDGRDVALSSFKHGLMGVQNVYMAARQWRESILLVKEFQKRINPSQFLEFKYEDFLYDPVAIFAELIDFLQIDDSEGKLTEYIVGHIGKDIKSDNFNKWKKVFTPSQKRLYEAVASDMLQAYGYETEFNATRRFSAIEKGYWRLDNKLRQIATPKYWGDNWYKSKLIFRRFFR